MSDPIVKTASQLYRLRDVENPQTLSLYLDVPLANAFERMLKVWERNNVIWKKLEIEICEFSAMLLCRTLDSVNKSCLFETIEIAFCEVYEEPEGDLKFFNSFETNHRLKTLRLFGLNLTQSNMEALSRTLRCSESLQELSFDSGCRGIWNDEEFCDALASNSSLESISLSCSADTSSVIAALASHRNLKKLHLKSASPSSWDDIADLLSSSACRLEELSIAFFHGASVTMEPLLHALRQNKCLKSLQMYSITCTDERPLCDLLHTWQSHPTLQNIALSHEFTNEDVRESLGVPEFQRHVSLENNSFDDAGNDDRDAALLLLLDKQPKLSFTHVFKASNSLHYMSYLNRKGRYLMTKDIPEGLLPLILTKVNQYLPKTANCFDEHSNSWPKTRDCFDERNSSYMESALYEHLHSTAFLQRSPPSLTLAD